MSLKRRSRRRTAQTIEGDPNRPAVGDIDVAWIVTKLGSTPAKFVGRVYAQVADRAARFRHA
jgi:hypothetical protein